MLRLTILSFMLLLWGCHHHSQPQDPLLDPDANTSAESLMAEFAHRH